MTEFYNLISSWVSLLTRPVVLLQILLISIPSLSYLFWLRPRLEVIRARFVLVVDASMLVLLKMLTIAIKAFGHPFGVSDFLVDAYIVWFLLALLKGFLIHRYGDDQTRRLYARVIRPLYVVLLLQQLIALFTSVDDLPPVVLFSLFGQDFTLLSLLLCLIVPYFVIVISDYAGTILARFLRRLLLISDSGVRALQLVLRYIIIAVGLLWLLNRIGLNSNAVAAIAGGLSIGVGFGVKELISNFISGLWLLFEGSVRPGDILFIDGEPCEVRNLSLRAATLWRQHDNAELVIPNQEFFTTTTTTYTGSDSLRRGELLVSAAYRHDPALVLPLLLQAAVSVQLVLKNPPPAVFLLQYGDSSIDYSIRYFVADPLTNLTARSLVSQAVWKIFAEHHIEIPFPQRVLHAPPQG